MNCQEVDHQLYDLARAAINSRISELSSSLGLAREVDDLQTIASIQAQKLLLAQELGQLNLCATHELEQVVLRYAKNFYDAEAALDELRQLRARDIVDRN